MNRRGMFKTLPPAVKPRKNAKPPMPISKPGFAIIVPLSLLPEYLKVNGLDIPDPQNPINEYEYDEKTHTLIVKKTGAK